MDKKNSRVPIKDLHEEIFHLYEVVQAAAMQLRRQVDAEPESALLVDSGYYLRECERLLDDARKELKGRREYINKLLCRIGLENFTNGGDLNVTGNYAKAYPDLKQAPKLPKLGSPEYDTLMDTMGVKPDIAHRGVLAVNFVKMTDYLTELAAEGKNPPAGLLGTFPQHTVIYRKKK